jgi:hypothetical protein
MEPTDEQKEFWKAAAAERKARGIVLRRWAFDADAESVGALYDMWDEWVELLGKPKAVTFFVHCMIKWTEALREAKVQQDRKRGKR